MPLRHYPIRVLDGSPLLTQPSTSLENVPPGGWIRMRNFRRSGDQLVRESGWRTFRPIEEGDLTQHVFDGLESVRRLADFRRANGDRVLVAAGTTTLKRFDEITATWQVIGSGFSPNGVRWQVEQIDVWLVLNNGVDLPVTYRVDDELVTPIYEIREAGIASVDRIAQYNSFLFLLGLVDIQEDQLVKFMAGYDSFVPTSTVTHSADFSLTESDGGTQHDVTTGVSTITATLPATLPSINWWVWVKKVDFGSGKVRFSPDLYGEILELTQLGDLALVWSDGKKYVGRKFPGGAVSTYDPYGIAPTEITQRIPYDLAWSEYAKPRNWAPIISVYMPAASATLTLPYETRAFIAGETRVAVVNGGPDNGTLGGQYGYENGILVTAVNGRQVTLEISTNTLLSYPRVVQIVRFTDTSTLVGRASLRGDGSAFSGWGLLNNLLLIAKETGWFTARYTGDSAAPFVFKPVYNGRNTPKWGDCIASVNGSFLLYPGLDRRFYQFDGDSAPRLYPPCDNARDLFFSGLADTAEPFVSYNEATKCIWFCRPGLVFSFDTEALQPSEIDAGIDAAVPMRRPGSFDQWFVLAIGSICYTYGLVKGDNPIETWHRNDIDPGATLITGLIHGGDTKNEKDLMEVLPILASPSPDCAWQVSIFGTHNPSFAMQELMVPPENLPNASGENWIRTHYRAIYYQLRFDLIDTRDIDARLSEIQFTFEMMRGGGVPRRNI